MNIGSFLHLYLETKTDRSKGTVPEVTIHPQTGGNAGSGNDAAGNAATGDVAGSDAAGESSTINSPDRPRHRATTRSTPERDDRGTLGTAVTPGQLPSTPASGPPGQLPTPFTGPGQTGDPTANAGTPSRAPTTAPPTTPPTAPPTAPPPNTAPPPRRPQQPAGNVAQPLQPSLSDMQEPHTWRDQRQPPVGARLLQILNWVNDEDIDRRRDWARELDEAEAWVLEQLDKRDENCLGDDTITLLRQAEAAMQTHRRNERYHYRTFMDLTIPKPDELPKYAPRLPYNSDDPIRLGVAGPKSKTTKIQPQLPDTPRPWRAVNNMWLTERERVLSLTPTLPDAREDGLLTLAASEDRLWAPQDGQDLQTINNNTVLAENGSYSTAIANDATSFSRGWVHWTQDPDAQEATRTIAGSNAPLLNTDNDFAVERGARRAGLQTALRQFHSAENHMIADNGRMLVLPGGTKAEAVPDLEEVKRKAGIGNSRPIPLTELPANQMQRIDGKTDPQGFIANMAQWWREARAARPDTHRYAMEGTFQRIYDVMHADRRDGRHALPPLSSFGPFVWRGVTAKVQLRQDCLRQMRGLKKLFEREKSIAMRQLLFDMDRAYQRGFDLDDDPEDLLMMDYFRDAVVSQSDSVDSDNPRYLDQMELDWIRFLLNHSMTEGMASEVLPRTAIFLAFAQRLERIFSDPGDSLFPDTETSVTIEDLIAHMAKMKGPVEKTTFYVYDVKMFLERLAFQGRCRYTEDWRSYGRVQRPVLKYYPENLIIWRPRNGIDTNELDYPEDRRTLTPRFEDVRTWHAIVHQEPQALDEDVRNYFLCLAYRWGWGTRYLETQEHEWKTTQPLPLHKSSDIVRRLVQGHEYCMGDGQNGGAARRVAADMETLWRHTLSKPDTAELPHDTTAIELIRKGVLHEVVRADNMLYPGRSTDYKDLLAPKTRESIWDWAKPQVRGKSKKFFSLNRWPLQLQSAKTQQRIKDDVDVDTSMLWNPIVEDPTPWTYYRPKAKPYGDDRIQFKSDQRLFPIGDTGRQKEVVKNQVMAMVGTGKLFPFPSDQPISGNREEPPFSDHTNLLQQWALCQMIALQMMACSRS